MKSRHQILIWGFFTCLSVAAQARVVKYDLHVTRQPVNLSGKKTVDFALMVNQSIPAPVLNFVEGDDAEITVFNELTSGEEVSIHWHGILLPPEEDGVAYVNTPPILKGQSRTFKFRLRQHGTYWYHSHTLLQEQKGVYGAFIVQPRKPTHKVDQDVVAIISDWSDENPDQVLRNLRKDGDYYLFKKGTMRSYAGALRAGKLNHQFENEWQRMPGMDYSDVGYDAFLINGRRDSQLTHARKGARIRVRLINASASTYFHVSLGAQNMDVIAADGVDIKPAVAGEIMMGMAETYDILFTVPENQNYELRATAQDGTGLASAWIGDGPKRFSVNVAPPDLYATMNHSHEGHNHQQEHSHHHHRPARIESLGVDDLAAQFPSSFSDAEPRLNLQLHLTGDMNRYIWHINQKTMTQDPTIEVKEGQIVRITLVNETMMHHPFHLHGHFFRVFNQMDKFSPLKHTVDVPPHAQRVIEFRADEPGRWMLHCHNLYHMKTGMARVVAYKDWKPGANLEHLKHQDPHMHDHLYTYGQVELATNHAQAYFKLMRTWDEVEARFESRQSKGQSFTFRDDWKTEGDLWYRRWFGNYLNLIAGGSRYHEHSYVIGGIGYIWPLLVRTNLILQHEGRVRLDFQRKFQWTSRWFTEASLSWRPGWQGDRETEFEVSLMYSPVWSWEAGFMATERGVGLGALVRF